MAKIAVLSQQVSHYTGGRYFCFEICCALGELGHDVHLFVDARRMPFEQDFDDYVRPHVYPNLGGHSDIKADVYIGLPIVGVTQACALGRRYGVPVIACILDVLPMMQKYRRDQNVVNMHAHLWHGMVETIKATDHVHAFVLANCNREPCARWLNLPLNCVHTIYPAVNHRALRKAPQKPRLNSICWISRIVAHKRFPHVLDAAKLLGLSVDVITAKPDYRMVKHRGVEHLVRWHLRISDKEKFEILKRSMAMVSASIWEGFGMFFIEALAAGTPAVVYRFPTYEEVAGEFSEYVYFAERDNRESLQVQLMKCLRDGKTGFNGDKRFTMNRLIKDLAITLQKVL